MNILMTIVLAVLILAVLAFTQFKHMIQKPDNEVIRWINATHAILMCMNNKNI
ncbi:hypothetical protein [Kingella sp. (in: b-proteobacteria)]|uniref:hypothetical protein n=1 Tax=Kingella sp. (in: b-proteobacteria) TaxID=2020713 RepID=UPI0026DC2BDB|nr:hypothetical protein [Kingella sp. (in: b-proteobacteria)]MDO4658166.1 hypothetical protein [Kingella sp. (in: b-proteobacteria)]